jgi:hypothetical protein
MVQMAGSPQPVPVQKLMSVRISNKVARRKAHSVLRGTKDKVKESVERL